MPEQPTASTMAVFGWIAGSVDAVGYRTLSHTFVSNMTGNTNGLGIALADGELVRAIERGFALLGFIVGVFVGTVISLRDTATTRDRHTLVLATELVLVAGTAIAILVLAPDGSPVHGSDWRFFVIAILASLSMGIQNTTFLAHDGPFATHVTGALTSLVHGITRRVLGRGAAHGGPHAGIWVGFLVGGLTSMLAFDASPFLASALPVPVLAVLLARRARQVRRDREAATA